MINELNISIFDFIFNVNMLNDVNNYSEYINQLNNMIKEHNNSNSNYEFWLEYDYMIVKNTIRDIPSLGGHQYGYFPFPKMTMSAIENYLNYKCKQFKSIIEENFDYDFSNINKDLNLNYSFALKKVIDYLISNKILTQDGQYVKKNILGYYEFDFELLRINNNNKQDKEFPLFNQTIVNNHGTMAYSYNGNSTINIQNQDDLFKIVLEKIEAMKSKNIPEEKLEELIKNCKAKDSSKVINLLQSLAVEVSSSLVVKGILMMFGIPC